MQLSEILALIALILTVGGALIYIIKAKRAGRRCIGCPHSKTCGRAGQCPCHSDTSEENEHS